jgi:TPR repeat protein
MLIAVVVRLTNSPSAWLTLLIVSYCLNSLPLWGEEESRQEFEARIFKMASESAELGDATAQRYLGNCYKSGSGVLKNDVEAVKWYRKAAEQGDADAQFYLGSCYQNGTGVVKNNVEAVKWYRKAAEKGDVSAQLCLGICYQSGTVVVKNEVEAYKWYLLAAAQGDEVGKSSIQFFEKTILSAEQRADGQRLATEWQAEFEAKNKP